MNAEKILEEIDKLKENCFLSEFENGYAAGAVDMANAIKDVICANMGDGKDTNVPSNGGWIPVEERLPEDERMVLVTCQTKKGIRSTNRAYYDGAFWHGSGSMSSVTAWQPLPEPYKPK